MFRALAFALAALALSNFVAADDKKKDDKEKPALSGVPSILGARGIPCSAPGLQLIVERG